MRWIERVDEIPRNLPAPRVSMGTFDGIHRGHEAVIRAALDLKEISGGSSVVVTFEPHPQEVLSPERPAARLTTSEEKRILLDPLGVDQVVALPFDRTMAEMDAAVFFRDVLGRLGMKTLLVGYNFTVGRGRGGGLETLRKIGGDLGFDVRIVSPVIHEGAPVSSTRIRGRVVEGLMASANGMLGHPYLLRGRVVRGAGRGRSLGFPTANLDPEDGRKLLPADGVYAARVRWGGEGRAGIMNIGRRPTFGAGERSVEVHILDFEDDIYGETLLVEVADRLREEERFADPEQLRNRIGRDVEAARHLLDKKIETRDRL